MMTNSNCESLQLNFLTSHSNQLDIGVQVMPNFSMSPWYYDIVYVLRNLQAPTGLRKTRVRSVKLKSANFCILNQYLYWKYPGGVLLNCLLENEAKQTVKEFHKGDCGGIHSWKMATNKVLIAGFYWPSMFSNVYKETTACHQCQIFDGKRKLGPLPVNPTSVEAPFQ